VVEVGVKAKIPMKDISLWVNMGKEKKISHPRKATRGRRMVRERD